MNHFTAKENFEKLRFNHFSTKDLLLEEDTEIDTNLFNDEKFQNLDSVYDTPDKLLSFGKSFSQFFI